MTAAEFIRSCEPHALHNKFDKRIYKQHRDDAPDFFLRFSFFFSKKIMFRFPDNLMSFLNHLLGAELPATLANKG